MAERLTDEYLDEIRKRKNRYMGQWTGTNGAMGADCHRLLMERESLLKEIEDMKAEMDMLPRSAHAALEVGPTDTTTTEDIPVDWILRGERALRDERPEEPVRRPLGASVIDDGQGEETPAERLLLDALAAVRDRRRKYGPPQDHFSITVALVNACFGTTFTTADWATVMQLDKIARSRGPGDCRDNNVDMAGYAACRDECQAP
jgi:hypothetical protein